jgi:dihydroflavonol-4-reductase
MATERDSWAGVPVCVTGGTGFLGFQLVRQLLDAGARVTVLALPPAPTHPLFRLAGVAAAFGDITDLETVRRAVRGCEVVFHAAGNIAAWGPALERMHTVHRVGTQNVLNAASPGARIVHTSSIVTIGASRHGQAVDEDTPYNLDHLNVDYMRCKRATEELALAAAAKGRDVVVVNPGYLIGPEDHEKSVMGRLCTRFWKGRLPFAPPGGFNLVDVRDAAAGHLRAAQLGRAGRRYILGGENHSFRALLALLAEAAQCAPRAVPRLPLWSYALMACCAEGVARWRRKEPHLSFSHVRVNRYCWFACSDRARRELGYVTRPVLESLRDAYAWHREHSNVTAHGLLGWWLRPERMQATVRASAEQLT